LLDKKGLLSTAGSVGINNPPVPKTDTQETENLDKAISFS
jgi:hypothetical protein